MTIWGSRSGPFRTLSRRRPMPVYQCGAQRHHLPAQYRHTGVELVSRDRTSRCDGGIFLVLLHPVAPCSARAFARLHRFCCVLHYAEVHLGEQFYRGRGAVRYVRRALLLLRYYAEGSFLLCGGHCIGDVGIHVAGPCLASLCSLSCPRFRGVARSSRGMNSSSGLRL